MLVNKRLFLLVKGSEPWLILTIITKLCKLAVTIIQITVLAEFIGKVFADTADLPSLYRTMIIIGGVILVKFILAFAESEFSFRSSIKIRLKLRETIMGKLLQLETGYLEKNRTAPLVTTTVEGVEALQVYFGKYLPQLFYSLTAPVILFLYLKNIQPGSAFVLLACVPLIPLSIIFIMRKAKKMMTEFWSDYEGLGDYFFQSLQGLYTLKMFGRDKTRGENLNKKAWKFRKSTMKVLGLQLTSIGMMDIIAYGGTAAGIIIAATALINGTTSPKGAILILFLASEFFLPLRLLGSYFHAGMNGVSATEKILKLVDEKPQISERATLLPSKLKDISKLKYDMKFSGVSFSYGKNQILNDMNISLEQGTVVGLVGESGSGKSTVASLMCRNYDPSFGNITLGGVDLKKIPLEWLRSHLAVVSHDSFIFCGTIADNLKMANEYATDEEIFNALRIAGLEEFVNTLPKKLLTDVGEQGCKLSGGQRQRLGLARAILYNADFYVFDEVTSNVDVESEKIIWKAIWEIATKKTVLIISHRLATVEKADKIYVMENGNIVESGSHKELIKLKGNYWNTARMQDLVVDVNPIEDEFENKGMNYAKTI